MVYWFNSAKKHIFSEKEWQIRVSALKLAKKNRNR